MKDLFGLAILDYQTNNAPENLITETSISESDKMLVAYLFRSFEQMPKIEQTALNLCRGNVLDVGCGAGSHSLYLQNKKNLNVTSIDISKNAIVACQLRGLKNAKVQNIIDVDEDIEKFDTILLLMNGTGIFGKLTATPKYLQKLKTLLNPNGQILIDSSDLVYMYDKDDLKSLQQSKKYYGELEFYMSYKNKDEVPFDWLYLDFETFTTEAANANLKIEKIIDGENFDYLVRLC